MRVLVTRPEPGATRTARKLAALGFEPVLLPLTRIEPLPLDALPDLEKFSAVAIPSANAVRHLPPAFLKQISHLPAFAVGERTGQVAAEAGLSVSDSSAGDAQRLAGRIIDTVASGSHILYLCGRVRRNILESRLTAAGLPVTAVETYDTMPLPISNDEFRDATANRPIDSVLVYSAFAAEVLSPFVSLLKTALFIAISERVAQKLPDIAGMRVLAAREPTEEAMLSMLPRRD
ncbi:uroporphyrinogen-III synthase [Chelativorans sp. J32]|uniref:uroporphyrinogen-III synthase n=1 Tax=Chelativorans sp. J32 TaxID=935840 RepID=UPI0004B79DAB|nr:uroporphyrinogen-III synthase [Chelativorans sp. J32]